MLSNNIMDFNKTALKDLIKIVRSNKKVKDVTDALGIKDIRYAKKKPLAEYMITHSEQFQILEEEPNIEDNVNDGDNDSYQDSPIRKEEIEEDKQQNVIQLDLSNIKNKKKPKPIQETPEEIEAKNNAMITIEKYYNKFTWLHEEKIDLSDPVRALKIVENKVSARNTSALISQNFFNICSGVESLAVNTPIVSKYVKIQGFTQNLKANDAVQDVLDELIIKYAPTITGENGLSVEARFGLIILGVMYQTHQINSISDQVKDIASKPVTRKFEI